MVLRLCLGPLVKPKPANREARHRDFRPLEFGVSGVSEPFPFLEPPKVAAHFNLREIQ